MGQVLSTPKEWGMAFWDGERFLWGGELGKGLIEGEFYVPGVVVYEYELKIGWGKSVSLPSQALPAPPPGHMAIRSKEGATVILSGPSGPPVTSVPNQNSELVG
ncbi:Protein RRC1 [Vitis vinifera]|uniref:Protein RRC1 n=1 Tax=Vitis vinifera TaxID=29760 RepID=A0A438KE78_VITVI|nr:Protein RRC1 [Vitis vinifera]